MNRDISKINRDIMFSISPNPYFGVYWRIMGFLWPWTTTAAYFVIYHRLICVCAYYLISWCVIPTSLKNSGLNIPAAHSAQKSQSVLSSLQYCFIRVKLQMQDFRNFFIDYHPKSGFGGWTRLFHLTTGNKPTRWQNIGCFTSAVGLWQIKVQSEWVHSLSNNKH